MPSSSRRWTVTVPEAESKWLEAQLERRGVRASIVVTEALQALMAVAVPEASGVRASTADGWDRCFEALDDTTPLTDAERMETDEEFRKMGIE